MSGIRDTNQQLGVATEKNRLVASVQMTLDYFELSLEMEPVHGKRPKHHDVHDDPLLWEFKTKGAAPEPLFVPLGYDCNIERRLFLLIPIAEK